MACKLTAGVFFFRSRYRKSVITRRSFSKKKKEFNKAPEGERGGRALFFPIQSGAYVGGLSKLFFTTLSADYIRDTFVAIGPIPRPKIIPARTSHKMFNIYEEIPSRCGVQFWHIGNSGATVFCNE